MLPIANRELGIRTTELLAYRKAHHHHAIQEYDIPCRKQSHFCVRGGDPKFDAMMEAIK